MSVNAADSARLNRILTVTLDRYSPQISNELARDDGIVAVFGARGAIKIANGGQRAIETLDVSENPNFDWRANTALIDTNIADTRLQAKYAWATLDGAVVLNDVEKAMNNGETKIYDMVQADVTNAKRTLVRKFADALRDATPGANQPESIKTIIQDKTKATQTGSTGELSRTTYSSFWRNQYNATSHDLSGAGWETLMGFMIEDCSLGASKADRPDFGLTTGALFAALSYQGDTNRRFTPDSMTLKLGFENVVINGATVIHDVEIPTGDLYLINTNSMFIQVLKTPGMSNVMNNNRPQSVPVSTKSFQDQYGGLNAAAVMYVTVALTCSSLQRQGIATNCS